MKLCEIVSLTEEQILSAPMYEMANLYPQKTGLDTVVWFGEVGGQHGPRIKVSNIPGKFAVNDCFVVSVEKLPRVLTPKNRKISDKSLDEVIDWIIVNYDILDKMWKLHESGDGDLDELLAQIIKI